MKKHLYILILIFLLCCGAACAKNTPASAEEPTDNIDRFLAEYDLDLSGLSDDQLEIFISLLHEQKDACDFANAPDGAVTWQSGEISNRLGGAWASSWIPLPDPQGDLVYQSLDNESFAALLKNYSLDGVQAYAALLEQAGFSQNISIDTNDTDFYLWHGANDTNAVNLTLQENMLWIEYLLSIE